MTDLKTDGATTSSTAAPAAPARSARSGGWTAVWACLVLAALILAALLVFIAQNSQHVEIRYLGANTSLAFGVALLFAAVAGVLLAVLVGGVLRIRHSLRARR